MWRRQSCLRDSFCGFAHRRNPYERQAGLPASRAPLEQIRELIEEVGSVMRAGRGFGMILHTEDRQFLVPHSFHGAIVQIYVRHLRWTAASRDRLRTRDFAP